MELQAIPAGTPKTAYSLAVHGGAGSRGHALTDAEAAEYHAGLRRALVAGQRVLAAGGPALEAVTSAVIELENDPLFNAGRGAALTSWGSAELDSSVMAGDGRAGAVAASRFARNPVLAARAVMEQTRHVLIVSPSSDRIAEWGLETVEPDYFVTPARVEQLHRLQDAATSGPRHGTVGAVARDVTGHLAAATSTGGIANQAVGRVGDTPVIGAGTFARDGVVAVSCTGQGEAFMRGVVAHDIAARIRYQGVGVEEAVRRTFAEELGGAQATGGVIAVDATGRTLLGFNSTDMFRGYLEDGSAVTQV